MDPATQQALDRMTKQLATYQPPDKAKEPKQPTKGKASKTGR